MTHVRGNVHLMKEINRATILGLLQKEKMLSRAQIAKTTKLSATTISSLVDELMNEGYIVETGASSSTGAGRKAITLEISRDKGYVISIGISVHTIYAVLSNFHGATIAQLSMPVVKGNEQILEAIVQGITLLINKASIEDYSLIKGIGISVPGIVDETSGTISYSYTLELHQFQIVKKLQFHYNLPIYVMNDTNAAALAEYRLVADQAYSNVLYVWIYEGIGARFILDGRVISGHKGRGGEVTFLHNAVYNSEDVLRRSQRLATKLDIQSPTSIEDVVLAYEREEEWIEKQMNNVLLCLSRAVVVMMNLIGPQKIILDGWFIQSSRCMQQIEQQINLHMMDTLDDDDDILVVPAKLGKRNYIDGATTKILEQIFKGKGRSVV
ncbi:MAG TPA: ROK family transcriptional regulator [Candidatus Paenibacillus intestinavium]|nr:ROK family transcriptional regulator [Candidatus Paenibacillus intestinavium]